jgi:hypothetical protein
MRERTFTGSIILNQKEFFFGSQNSLSIYSIYNIFYDINNSQKCLTPHCYLMFTQ